MDLPEQNGGKPFGFAKRQSAGNPKSSKPREPKKDNG